MFTQSWYSVSEYYEQSGGKRRTAVKAHQQKTINEGNKWKERKVNISKKNHVALMTVWPQRLIEKAQKRLWLHVKIMKRDLHQPANTLSDSDSQSAARLPSSQSVLLQLLHTLQPFRHAQPPWNEFFLTTYLGKKWSWCWPQSNIDFQLGPTAPISELMDFLW